MYMYEVSIDQDKKNTSVQLSYFMSLQVHHFVLRGHLWGK